MVSLERLAVSMSTPDWSTATMVFEFFGAATSCGVVLVAMFVPNELSHTFSTFTVLPFVIYMSGPAATAATLLGVPVPQIVRRVWTGDHTYTLACCEAAAVGSKAPIYALEPSLVNAAATAPGRMKVCNVLLLESKMKSRCEGTSAWNLTLEIMTLVPSCETARITPIG